VGRKIIENLIGKKYGRWQVLRDGIEKYCYVCLCDCGTIAEVEAFSLRTGKSKSCGCLRKEVLSLNNSKHNVFYLHEDFGICYMNFEKFFYFDLDDYNFATTHYWSINGGGYAFATFHDIENNTYKPIIFHRHVMQLDNTNFEIIDHKNRNRLDNRKENLRIANRTENSINKGIQSNNTTGIIGVSKNSHRGKTWRSRISYNKIQYLIGYFDDFEEAVYARLTSEKEYFGNFAPQRHLFHQYGIEE
jgi:hypothetical protein